METQWIHMENPQEAERGYEEGIRLLLAGENVAFPTETVYGLGGYIGSEEGLRGIFRAKGRPSDNPLIVHIYPGYDVGRVARKISPQAERLMARYWPGPMTLIFEKAPGLSPLITAGLDTVAVRMPNHPVALELMRRGGLAVAAPSANLSGRPSPTTAEHVYEDMKGRIPLVLDGGACQVGLESTIIDMTAEPPMVLRPGGLTIEEIREILPDVRMDPGLAVKKDVVPKAPGMKYRHYAPKAPMWMALGSPEEQEEQIRRGLLAAEGSRRGVLTVDEHRGDFDAEVILSLGSRQDPEGMAARLFDALRRFDEERCEILFAESISREGIGEAFMNRLQKACGGKTLKGDDDGRTGISGEDAR